MRCPKCDCTDTHKITHTEQSTDTVWRRRKCRCSAVWHTWETATNPKASLKEIDEAVEEFVERVRSIATATQPPATPYMGDPAPAPALRTYQHNGISLPSVGKGWHL